MAKWKQFCYATAKPTFEPQSPKSAIDATLIAEENLNVCLRKLGDEVGREMSCHIYMQGYGGKYGVICKIFVKDSDGHT